MQEQTNWETPKVKVRGGQTAMSASEQDLLEARKQMLKWEKLDESRKTPELARKILALFDGGQRYLDKKESKDRWRISLERASLYECIGDYKQQLFHLDAAVGPPHLISKNKPILSLIKRAEYYRQMKLYELEAVDRTTLLKLDPRDALAYFQRATTYRRYAETFTNSDSRTALLKSALDDANRGFELNGDRSSHQWRNYFTRGLVLKQLQQFSQAIRDFEYVYLFLTDVALPYLCASTLVYCVTHSQVLSIVNNHYKAQLEKIDCLVSSQQLSDALNMALDLLDDLYDAEERQLEREPDLKAEASHWAGIVYASLYRQTGLVSNLEHARQYLGDAVRLYTTDSRKQVAGLDLESLEQHVLSGKVARVSTVVSTSGKLEKKSTVVATSGKLEKKSTGVPLPVVVPLCSESPQHLSSSIDVAVGLAPPTWPKVKTYKLVPVVVTADSKTKSIRFARPDDCKRSQARRRRPRYDGARRGHNNNSVNSNKQHRSPHRDVSDAKDVNSEMNTKTDTIDERKTETRSDVIVASTTKEPEPKTSSQGLTGSSALLVSSSALLVTVDSDSAQVGEWLSLLCGDSRYVELAGERQWNGQCLEEVAQLAHIDFKDAFEMLQKIGITDWQHQYLVVKETLKLFPVPHEHWISQMNNTAAVAALVDD